MQRVIRGILLLLIVVGLLLVAAIWRLSKNQHSSEVSLSATPEAPQAVDTVDCQLENLPQQTIRVNDQELTVAVAATSPTRTQGLSGCEAITGVDGMLFTFDEQAPARFWMKDMLIPLDIIWIADSAITGIEENVPPPAPNTPNNELVQYPSPGAIDAVLEIAAGQSKARSFIAGGSVEY